MSGSYALIGLFAANSFLFSVVTHQTALLMEIFISFPFAMDFGPVHTLSTSSYGLHLK